MDGFNQPIRQEWARTYTCSHRDIPVKVFFLNLTNGNVFHRILLKMAFILFVYSDKSNIKKQL